MVVLYDQLGCGRSDQPAEKAYYTIERFCAGLLALQDKLALPQAALLGHGTGGWIAQEYAIRRPKRVAALILAGTTTSAAAKEAAERAAAAQLGAGLAKVLIEDRREDPLYAEAMNTYRRRFVYRAETVPSWLTELEQAMAANVSRRLMVGDNRFDIQGTFGRFDAKPRLRQIQAATFVMTGEHDIAGPEAAAALADSIPHAELKILPGLSHLAHIEDAAAATATVGTFLARVDDRRRR
jgi:proline-specific peptidase